MKINEENKTIIGFFDEKPTGYAEGWEFQEIDSGKKYLISDGKWKLTNRFKNNTRKLIPDKQLFFKPSGIIPGAGMCFHCSEILGKSYFINSNIRSFDGLITGTITNGTAWLGSTWGQAQSMIVFQDESFVVFTNKTVDANAIGDLKYVCSIWKFTNINDSNPTEVYLSNHSSKWTSSNAFGIDYYLTGFGSIILAGEYGNTPTSKDCILSLDNGATWSVIKSTGDSTFNNNHFHDVAIDPYNSILWVGQGDGVDDSAVSWSQTMGSDFVKLKPHSKLGVGIQPTFIMSFPFITLFGNDSALSGFGAVDSPRHPSDWNDMLNGDDLPYPYHITRNLNIGGEPCYPQYPNKWGNNQAICIESGHGGQYPGRIFMTGDGGISWHTVSLPYFGAPSGFNISSVILGMDENHIYCRLGSTGEVVFAEKPNFK